jgi:murein DD-endopeptidase MepM/ murein hydrolase activator NlpD
VSDEFGTRGGAHRGLDLAAGCGTPIYAVAAGTVMLASSDPAVVGGYGKYIVIDHGGGMRTGYGHEQVMRVATGQRVSKGQHIADMGTEGESTGCHLHFDVRIAPGGPFSEQIDPKPVLLDNGVTYWADQ